MILLSYVEVLVFIALITFFGIFIVKLYIGTESVRYSAVGVFHFVWVSISFPFIISNYIYTNRSVLIKKLKEDSKLTKEQKKELEVIIKSRMRLYYIMISRHFLRFPDFIELYSRAYIKWFRDKKQQNNGIREATNFKAEIKQYSYEMFSYAELFKKHKERLI